MMTDPIADLLTRVRNAQKAGHENVTVKASKMKQQILYIMSNEGYLGEVDYIKDDMQGLLRATLKYDKTNKGVIDGLKRISRPGLRTYKSSKDIEKVRGGMGIAIVSTSKGIMTDRKARRENVGGEVLCEIW